MKKCFKTIKEVLKKSYIIWIVLGVDLGYLSIFHIKNHAIEKYPDEVNALIVDKNHDPVPLRGISPFYTYTIEYDYSAATFKSEVKIKDKDTINNHLWVGDSIRIRICRLHPSWSKPIK